MKKHTHVLLPHHHRHLSNIGVPWLRPPFIRATAEEYRVAYEAWKETHPEQSHDFLHTKALGHLAWAQHYAEQSRPPEEKRRRWDDWVLKTLLGVIIVLALTAHAHCQFSHINYIDVQNQGSDIGFFTFPFTVNFTGAGVSCARSGAVVTCTVTGGSITNNPGGSNTNVQYNNSGAFGGIANGTLGQVLISQGPGVTPAFADPLVQGTKAEGAAIDNPITIGGKDGSGNNKAFAVDASGRGTVNVNGNVAVTQADGADTTLGAKADAKSTATDTTAATIMQVMKEISFMEQNPASRAVTGTFWQATQPVSGTFWQATQPISAASLPLPTGAAQDSSLTTLDTDVKSNVTLHAGSNIVGKVTTDQTTHGTTDLVAADITKVGGAAVALGQTTATASIPVVIASDQSPLAVFARTMPLLNYSSFTLQDANTVLWVTTMSDTGALNTVTTTSGTVLPLYFNDIATRSTYQIGVSTAGVLTETLVTFNPQYPAAIGFVTSGGKKSALLMNSAVFYALQPTSVADWNVAVADGGDVTEGAIADTKVTGDAGGTLSAKLRGINYSLAQIARQTNVSITAQIQPTRLVGALNQPIGTPASPISVLPANTSGCAGSTPQQTMSTPINMSTAVTTKMITGSASGWTYICASDLVVAGADNAALVYGTGSNCGTGTTALAGGTTAATGWNLAANGGLAKGNGQGIMWKVPPGNDTCLATSAAVQASGSLTFAQF